MMKSGVPKFGITLRPRLFYLLDYGISSLQKPKSEKKKKFRTIIFHLRVPNLR
jgi:hypothetical protein